MSVPAADHSADNGSVVVQHHPSSLLATLDFDKEKFLTSSPHDADTELGKRPLAQFGLEGAEVTDDVFELQSSLMFDPNENPRHTNKAVMATALGG